MSDLLFSYLNFSEFLTNAAFIFCVLVLYGRVTNCHKISDLNMYIYCIIICKGLEARSGLASSAQGLKGLL